MKKYNALITIGIITALIPFLGIPSSWKYFFTFALGLAIAIISTLLRRNEILASKGLKKPQASSYARTYIENNEE